MRVRWIAAALTLALCFSLAACGHPPVSEEQEEDLTILRIGSDDYEPYSYLDETGDFTGIDVDLAREACRRLGYRPEFHQVVWENKDQELAAGNIDCLWGSFSIDGREDEVRAAIERAGFTVTAHDSLEEWHCFTATLA